MKFTMIWDNIVPHLSRVCGSLHTYLISNYRVMPAFIDGTANVISASCYHGNISSLHLPIEFLSILKICPKWNIHTESNVNTHSLFFLMQIYTENYTLLWNIMLTIIITLCTRSRTNVSISAECTCAEIDWSPHCKYVTCINVYKNQRRAKCRLESSSTSTPMKYIKSILNLKRCLSSARNINSIYMKNNRKYYSCS